MIDEKKIAQYNAEMAAHANGAAQFLVALIGGKFVTREQAREMADYVLAQTKRNIESCPFGSQEEKDVGLILDIYDEEFITTIKHFLGSSELSMAPLDNILEILLIIENAKMFFYKFLSSMYNDNQPRTCPNGTQRLREGINLWRVVKEIRDNEFFYDGWNPQESGTLIMNTFFVKKIIIWNLRSNNHCNLRWAAMHRPRYAERVTGRLPSVSVYDRQRKRK